MRKGGVKRMARAGAKRQHGSAYALALALQLGGQGLLFCPIERTNALKKGVMGEGKHLANALAAFNEDW